MILALDLATTTGWALLREPGGKPEFGTWELQGEVAQQKCLDLREILDGLYRVGEPSSTLVVERPHLRGWNSSLHGMGLFVTATVWAEENGIPYVDVHTATVKKAFTGDGRASKEDMLKAARRRWGIQTRRHDVADALGALWWARELGLGGDTPEAASQAPGEEIAPVVTECPECTGELRCAAHMTLEDWV